ncbi:MAG: AMP-binding protein [Corynebacterium sp.]|uniref:class I adenylate-forming enzyme family protein n=2 Tax=Corynebacterium TaxID=1716 RepID=UPI00264891AD|nr:AMP-binding protein [Corynebacterium sp.]MDN5722618.1 AMP-binding protein [Corynebacterium sp.]
MLFAYLPWNIPDDRQDSPCIRDNHHSLTYLETSARSRAVAVMLPNCCEFVVTMFGAWYLGATVTPVNPAFTDSEAIRQLEDSGAHVVICADPARCAHQVRTVDVATVTALIEDCTEAAPEAASGVDTPYVLTGDDTALVVYTSGSTGRPKGAMLGHSQLDAMSAAMEERMRTDSTDHCMLVLPLFHVNAILVSILTPLRCGAQVTLVERFAPQPFLEIIEQHRPTYFSSVPTILSHLADLPLEGRPATDSLQFIICGAAPASPELLTRVNEQFGATVVEGYGLTEGTCCSTCNPVHGEQKVGTVGPAMPGQIIRVVNEAGDDVPTGTAGEVIVSGPTVMQGYLNLPEATARTVVDGWLHTGDIGHLDEDGYLTLIDRVKDMIIRGGENIYPKEIEAVLYGVDGVLEAAVVARPQRALGEEPVAVVSLMQGSPLTVADLLEHCRMHLTKIKLPVDLEIVAEIPKNPVGKIDKPTLHAQFLAPA